MPSTTPDVPVMITNPPSCDLAARFALSVVPSNHANSIIASRVLSVAAQRLRYSSFDSLHSPTRFPPPLGVWRCEDFSNPCHPCAFVTQRASRTLDEFGRTIFPFRGLFAVSQRIYLELAELKP